MANEQSFEFLKDESLNTSDPSSNRKKKGEGVIETARPGAVKARKWSDTEVVRPRAIFWANQYGADLFHCQVLKTFNGVIYGL